MDNDQVNKQCANRDFSMIDVPVKKWEAAVAAADALLVLARKARAYQYDGDAMAPEAILYHIEEIAEQWRKVRGDGHNELAWNNNE